MRLFPGPAVRVLELQRYKMRLEQLNNRTEKNANERAKEFLGQERKAL